MNAQTAQAEPIAYRVAVAADRLGIGRSNLYKEIQAGRLKVRKFGRRTLVERVEVERWLSALPLLSPSEAE